VRARGAALARRVTPDGPEARDEPKLFFGLEVTRRCNLSCPHCFTAAGAAAHPGPTRAEVRSLMEQLVAAGTRHLAFSGGQPLARRDLEDLMADGRAAGMKSFSMVSNGVLASPRRVERLRRPGSSACR
jgi:MoaA/NifB/PqqE/SkfB family radical SAM enzyme